MSAFVDNIRGEGNISCDDKIAGAESFDYLTVRDIETGFDQDKIDSACLWNSHGLIGNERYRYSGTLGCPEEYFLDRHGACVGIDPDFHAVPVSICWQTGVYSDGNSSPMEDRLPTDRLKSLKSLKSSSHRWYSVGLANHDRPDEPMNPASSRAAAIAGACLEASAGETSSTAAASPDRRERCQPSCGRARWVAPLLHAVSRGT